MAELNWSAAPLATSCSVQWSMLSGTGPRSRMEHCVSTAAHDPLLVPCPAPPRKMDVYKEAMDYLQTCNIAGVNETETDLVEDVFGAEAEDSFTTTALQADGADLPETPTDLSPDVLLDRRLQVLQNILKHEQQYLSELETLLTNSESSGPFCSRGLIRFGPRGAGPHTTAAVSAGSRAGAKARVRKWTAGLAESNSLKKRVERRRPDWPQLGGELTHPSLGTSCWALDAEHQETGLDPTGPPLDPHWTADLSEHCPNLAFAFFASSTHWGLQGSRREVAEGEEQLWSAASFSLSSLRSLFLSQVPRRSLFQVPGADLLRLSASNRRIFSLSLGLQPMKALKASASTSQPVLSSQQVETLFYQVPELRDLHRDFYSRLRDRLGLRSDLQPDQDKPQGQGATHPPVGDLFLKMVSQLGVYRGFIDNYESAVDIVRTCTQAEPRFRTLAESMMSSKGPDNSRTEYTLEALLYKPLDRVTKTTLVLHDLLKHTPLNHPDHSLLQEALRISSSFLSGVNEDSHCKRARRQLMRDGFVVDMCEGEHSLRHLFLYTDLLLCTKLKGGAAGSVNTSLTHYTHRRKPAQYRFSWYLPLPGLRLFWGPVKERPVDLQQRVLAMRGKMFQIREELQQRGAKGLGPRTLDRSYKKLQQCELWLFTHAPLFSLELHSPSGK
ncbi:hypothetical protein Z043_124863, partial [Scleropages formosus]